MFSQFYGLPFREANDRIRAPLKLVGLEGRTETKSSDLSTGLRQKMNIVRGFLTDPQVLFLDEPTLGLDVGASLDLDVLLAWLRPVGYAIPITYWLELMRRSLAGNVAQAFPTLARFTDLQLIGILLGLSIVFGTASIFIFRYCDYRAREQGLIDRVSNY